MTIISILQRKVNFAPGLQHLGQLQQGPKENGHYWANGRARGRAAQAL